MALWTTQLAILVPGLPNKILASAAGSMPATASLRTLKRSFADLESVGLSEADIAALVKRRPAAPAALAARSPAPTFAILEQLGVHDICALVRAQPSIVVLDPARVAAAVTFICRYGHQTWALTRDLELSSPPSRHSSPPRHTSVARFPR